MFLCLIFHFSLHWKLSLLLAILLICLSSPPTVKHDRANLHHITPLFSSPVSKMKAFLCRQNSESFLCAEPRPVLLAFSSSVCRIFWFIYTLLIVAPHACQESQSQNLCMCIMPAESNSYLKYTWMHEYIYCREAPVHPGEFHFLWWPSFGMEWRDPWRRPTCSHQIGCLVRFFTIEG